MGPKGRARVVGVLCVAALMGCTGQEPPSTPTTAPAGSASTSSTVPANGLTSARAEEIIRNAGSGDSEAVRAAIAMPEGQAVTADQTAQLKAVLGGATVEPASLRAIDEGATTVRVVNGDRAWLVYLVKIDDKWMISLTEEQAP